MMKDTLAVPFRNASRRGFTLVEMLVVIAIIALLASLIVPGVGKVRARAHATTTLSNLRQLHAANQQHALEYGGFYCPWRMEQPEDSDNPDTFWLDNDHFGQFLHGADHNGWNDWPSVYKTGTPNANLKASRNPSGNRSKMSIGMSTGRRFHAGNEKDKAFTATQLSAHPRMIMFADSAQWLVFGVGGADQSPRDYDDAKGGKWGGMAFRYDGRAGVVRVDGSAEMVRYGEILPSSEHPESWPDIDPLPFRFYLN